MPFGSPAHLLDAARYVAKAWENISATTVKNAFIKADLHMALESGVAEDDLSIDGLISELGAMQISLSNEEFDNNLHLDDDTSKEYQNCLIEEVDEIIEEHEKEIRNGTQTPSSTNPSTSFEEFCVEINELPSTDDQPLQCGLEEVFQNSLKIFDKLSSSQLSSTSIASSSPAQSLQPLVFLHGSAQQEL